MPRLPVLARFLTTVALLVVPSAASAHIGLRRSEPAKDDSLTAPPARITLWFTMRPQAGFSRIRLLGPGGEIALGPLAADTGNAVGAAVAGAMPSGNYIVRWQTASADGHIIRGEYAFTLAMPARPAATPSAEQGAAEHAPRPEAHVEHKEYRWVRWIEFVALMTVLGVLGFRHGVLPPLAARGVPVADASDRARRIGQSTLVLYFFAVVYRLIDESAAVHGAANAIEPSLVSAMLTGTTWGIGWSFGAIGALLTMVGWRMSRRSVTVGTPLALIGALGMALSPALSGHAVVGRPAALSVGADALHVLAAGVWTGGLLILLIAGIPAMRRLTGDVNAAVAALVNSFHPMALFCAPLVVLSGATNSWLRLGEIGSLWVTPYGRALLVKLGLFGLVALMGAYNALRARRALGAEAASRRIRMSGMIEVVFAALVLAATTWLVVTPVPSDTAGS